MRIVVVLEEAEGDLLKGKDFYDLQEKGLGDYFFDSLLADIESLALFHGIHSMYFGCYRMLASRFSFGIYYLEKEKETQVIAVLDLRQNPSWLHQELQNREA